MGVLVAAVVGFLVGLALDDLAGAVALALLAGLLVRYQALHRRVTDHHEQLSQLAAELLRRAAVPATEKIPQAPSPTPVRPATAPPPVAQPVTPAVSQPLANDHAWSGTRSSSTQGDTPKFSSVLAEKWRASALGRALARTNLVTRVGIVILFLGISFLLKYAAQHVSVPVEVRLVGIAVAALVAFGLGWRLRTSRREYALLLQGAAVGTWYLVTFAAMKLYPVIPPTMGFFLLTGLSVFAALMSVMQDARSLAVFGILGGFLAPVLASTGAGGHVMLFSYYATLNAGIVAIVWFKAWRPLTLMGFLFTFVIAVAWGVTRYKAELFASTEPFLILFMLFYVAVVMMFALRKRLPPHAFVDGPILFGTPVIGFGLQAQLVEDFEYGMAWSCLGFGLFYLGLAVTWWKMLSERAPLLREALLAIGIVMLTLAIPYAFGRNVTALAWAFEGAAAIWLATRQQRNWGGLLALLVQVGAGVAWLTGPASEGEVLFFNASYAGSSAIALVALWSAWLLRDQPATYWVRRLHLPMLGWALLWWFGSALWQFDAHLFPWQTSSALLIFVSLSMVALQGLRVRYQWQALAPVPLGLLLVALFQLVTYRNFGAHPFAEYGYLAWPLVFITLYWLYNRPQFFAGITARAETSAHAVTYLMLVALALIEASWQIHQWSTLESWHVIVIGVTLLAAIAVAQKARFWPARLTDLYRRELSAMLFVALLVDFLVACFVRPLVQPLPYWPLLNPLDAWQLAVLACAWVWWRTVRNKPPFALSASFGVWAVLGLSFFYLNTLLLRTVHILADISFRLRPLAESDLVQTCFSLLWTLVGIGLLVAATRLVRRELWMLGMGLIAVVVLKLLLVDLANTGTVERIVSFIGVGVLLLGVGYLAPLPERQDAEPSLAGSEE